MKVSTYEVSEIQINEMYVQRKNDGKNSFQNAETALLKLRRCLPQAVVGKRRLGGTERGVTPVAGVVGSCGLDGRSARWCAAIACIKGWAVGLSGPAEVGRAGGQVGVGRAVQAGRRGCSGRSAGSLRSASTATCVG